MIKKSKFALKSDGTISNFKEIRIKKVRKSRRFLDIEDIILSEQTWNALYTRKGLDFVSLWFTKIVVVDFIVKVVSICGFGSTIWSDSADHVVKTFSKDGGTILSALGNKFKKL